MKLVRIVMVSATSYRISTPAIFTIAITGTYSHVCTVTVTGKIAMTLIIAVKGTAVRTVTLTAAVMAAPVKGS